MTTPYVSNHADDNYGVSEEKIKVAVRVRPFSEREEKISSKNCVDIQANQNQVVVKDAEKSTKGFAYDFVYSQASNKNPVLSQETIFNDLRFFVDNAIAGYNSSVFAYGQTGSGKTYTMMGTPKSPGLIPRGCEALFSQIERSSAKLGKKTIEVDASYLEIYMDKIYDLLVLNEHKRPKRKRKAISASQRKIDRQRRTKLPIRFNSKRGAYVEGLTTHTVASFQDVKALMDAGLKNRTIAETGMNRMSSRSHCIFTLTVKSEEESGEIVTASINLIDLAGSERVNKTGVFGTRLEELKKINKSLSALGDVISALSQNQKFVPYNNSVLTTLLKESLGGNSKTIMIATISPAMENYAETLSTLRYAARVKKIRTTAIRNLGETKTVIEATLRKEIARLKQQLSTRGRGNVEGSTQLELALQHAQDEHARFKLTHEQKILEMKSQLDLMEKNFQKLGFKNANDMEKNKLIPQLRNISADPALTGNLVYFLEKEKLVAGCGSGLADPSAGPDIVLVNQDDTILPVHAVFERHQYTEVKRKESTMNLQEWRRMFDKCSGGRSHLNHLEFKKWLTMVIGKDDPDVQMMQRSQFEQICKTLHADPKVGLSWEQVLVYFGLGDHQAQYREIEILGIPREKLQGANGHQMVKDLKEHVLHPYKLARTFRKGATLCIQFKKGIYSSDTKNIEVQLKDLLRDTNYGPSLAVKPIEPKEVKHRVTITNPDPSAPNLMIFVNGQRVANTPIVLKHNDKIIFGSKHVFQFINPTEAGDNPLEMMQNERNLEEELSKTALELTRVKKQLDEERRTGEGQKVIDDIKKRLIVKLDESTTKVVELESEIKRMEGLARRSKQKMLEKREEFMTKYRNLSSKVQAANTMSMDLSKRVSFQIIVLPYYDPQVDSILDRLMVSRACHMTDPELHIHMLPEEFEHMLEQMLQYYEIAIESPDDEESAMEAVGDDPFVPGELDSLCGEAVIKISHELPEGEFSLDIVDLTGGTKVGELFASIVVHRLKANQPKKRVMKTSRMKGRAIDFTLSILGIELEKTQKPVSASFVTYCFVDPNIHVARSVRSGKPSRTHNFKHRNPISVPNCENVFLKFLGDGIRLRVWTAVPFSPTALPNPIFYKIHNRAIELKIVHASSEEEFRINAQTGQPIFKLKQRLENELDQPAESIELRYKSDELDDQKTLADYAVSNNDTLSLTLRPHALGARSPTSDSTIRNEADPSLRQMLHLLDTSSPTSEREMKEENAILRKMLREALTRINELRKQKPRPRRTFIKDRKFLGKSG